MTARMEQYRHTIIHIVFLKTEAWRHTNNNYVLFIKGNTLSSSSQACGAAAQTLLPHHKQVSSSSV